MKKLLIVLSFLVFAGAFVIAGNVDGLNNVSSSFKVDQISVLEFGQVAGPADTAKCHKSCDKKCTKSVCSSTCKKDSKACCKKGNAKCSKDTTSVK
jgi:hypothetical protein